MRKKRIVVIGAGFGGLSAASYLAKAGYTVTVLEKNNWLGGRAETMALSGATVDMGPSWYWMPEVFEQFFRDFGSDVPSRYQLKRLDPSYRVYFPEEYIDLPAGADRLYELFESREPGAGQSLRTFLRQTGRVYDIAMKSFIARPFASPLEFLNPELLVAGIRLLLTYNGFRSAESFITRSFRSDILRKLLYFPYFFLGSSVRETPAVYAMMNYVDMVLGTWYPVGGFGNVARAFGDIASEQGATILTNQDVVNITLNQGKVASVTTANGNSYEADILLANSDYYYTESILPVEYRSYSERYWQNRKLAPSAALSYSVSRKTIPGLLHHTLFFTNDWTGHNQALFSRPTWPEHPLFYLSCPTKNDATIARPGHEVLTLLVPVASGLDTPSASGEAMLERVYPDLERVIGYPVRTQFLASHSYTPDRFATDFHAFRNNAYGLGHSLFQTASFRPRIRSRRIPNLFYTGQFTVPGIGVPMTVLSGKIAAHEIVHQYGHG